MKKLLFVLLLVSIISGKNVFAQESAEGEVTPDLKTEEYMTEEAYVFPVIKPDILLFGGYRYVHSDISDRAEEFEYLHDSLTLGGEARVFSFPHRFHLDLDIKNKKDYFGDISYAYEDIILFRAINRTLWHNLDNITLRGVALPSAGVNVTDNGVTYGVKAGITDVFLRFKTHNFPFHVYIDGGLIDREGAQQLRSLSGSGSFNDIVRASRSRDVDWHTKTITVGANSHLGPIEVDISHGEKRFDVGANNVFFDPYTAVVSGTTVTRNADTFPHNLISELKGSSNTLKLHTSYTGSLVASATFSQIERKNRDSGAKADYFIGAGEVTWIASPRLAFFAKYRHKEADIDNPDSITFANVCAPSNNPSNTYACFIKPSISSITNAVSGTARFRVTSGMTLRAEFSYENIDRKDTAEWFVPDSTTRKVSSLSADIRIARNAKLTAKYTHLDIENPETNIEPDHSDEGRISFTWVPLPGLSTLLSYRVAKERRSTLQFVQQDPVTSVEFLAESPDKRDALRDRFLGSITYLVLKDLSLTASYSYIHNKVKEDLAFHDTSGNLLFDPRVPETDTAHSYSFDANYLPKNNIALTAGVSYTLSSGAFFPADINLTQPVSIASFSQLKTRETVYSVSGEYRFKNGFSAGIRYRYSVFDDVLDNPFDDVNDGKAHIVLLTLSKKW